MHAPESGITRRLRRRAPNEQSNLHAGMSKHVHERVQGEAIDFATIEIADPWLGYTEQRRGVTLSQVAPIDDGHNGRH